MAQETVNTVKEGLVGAEIINPNRSYVYADEEITVEAPKKVVPATKKPPQPKPEPTRYVEKYEALDALTRKFFDRIIVEALRKPHTYPVPKFEKNYYLVGYMSKPLLCMWFDGLKPMATIYDNNGNKERVEVIDLESVKKASELIKKAY